MDGLWWKTLLKMDDLGVQLFWEAPICLHRSIHETAVLSQLACKGSCPTFVVIRCDTLDLQLLPQASKYRASAYRASAGSKVHTLVRFNHWLNGFSRLIPWKNMRGEKGISKSFQHSEAANMVHVWNIYPKFGKNCVWWHVANTPRSEILPRSTEMLRAITRWRASQSWMNWYQHGLKKNYWENRCGHSKKNQPSHSSNKSSKTEISVGFGKFANHLIGWKRRSDVRDAVTWNSCRISLDPHVLGLGEFRVDTFFPWCFLP